MIVGYTLDLPNLRGEVYSKTTDGGIGAFIFRTKELADAYIVGRGKAAEWVAGAVEDFDQWLADLRKNKVTCLLVNLDPREDHSQVRYCPLDAAILHIELSGHRSVPPQGQFDVPPESLN